VTPAERPKSSGAISVLLLFSLVLSLSVLISFSALAAKADCSIPRALELESSFVSLRDKATNIIEFNAHEIFQMAFVSVKADDAAERVLFKIFLAWNFDLYIAQWARAIERRIIFVCCPSIALHPLL